MTAAISRSTPRVRWNFSSVDQSVEELVEELGMDRVGGLEPPPVVAFLDAEGNSAACFW